MDNYDQAFARHKHKRRDKRRMLFICTCCIMLGYVLGNLSCLVLLVCFGV